MNDLRFKILTIDNFLEPDSTLSAIVSVNMRDGSTRQLSAEDWARRMLAVELAEQVPVEVRRLFAVARGSLLYGFYFYPLFTLGTEQLFRVAEAAVRHKCQELGLKSRKKYPDFYDFVGLLIGQGIIPSENEGRWDTLRNLRNLVSHPEDQNIFSPGIAIDLLRGVAADISELFSIDAGVTHLASERSAT